MSFDCSWIHHDGSAQYVENLAPQPGDLVGIWVRVPRAVNVDRVWVRTIHDGEPVIRKATASRETATDIWWRAELPIHNSRTHYRFGFAGGSVGYGWLNAAGFFDHDVPDAYDFAISTAALPPQWSSSSVVYQIYPDRFASSGRTYEIPEWAVPRTWDMRPEGRSNNTSREYFGGDLWGVADKLDYLQELGINVLYFTPFFPAGSTHRYDASSFDTVDPLLGGDEAFIHLSAQAHKRGMKVVGDITLNHSGVTHEWFQDAMEGHPVHSTFYTFNPSFEFGYACWLGVRSLPKFNYESAALRERLISGSHSTIRTWLREPFNLDGWRVDVANMTGRQGDLDVTAEVAKLTRDSMAAEGDDKILIAEHFHDAGPDLDGDGWHGTMNYSAFMKPVWTWLVEGFPHEYLGIPIDVPSISAKQMAATIREFSARMPWRSYNSSWSLLCSHDTARIRSVVGSDARQNVAVGLLCTLPGTPMIFAGDELAAEGLWGEDSRTPHPWEKESEWNRTVLDWYKTVISLRRTENVLAEGGLRWIHAGTDAVAYLRETKDSALLIVGSRNATSEVSVNLPNLGYSRADVVATTMNNAPQGALGALPIDSASFTVWRLS
jgi:alpha-glucosidase